MIIPLLILKNYDYAIVAQLPENIGSIGLSANTFSFSFPEFIKKNIYHLVYARKLIENLSLGLSIDYYQVDYEPNPNVFLQFPSSYKGEQFFLTFATHFNFPSYFRIFDNDKFGIGFQFRNIFNTKIRLTNNNGFYIIPQGMRFGLGYHLVPPLNKIYGFDPISLLLAADLVYTGRNYDLRFFHPNFGIELTLADILQLSFGRENFEAFKLNYFESPEFPVNRYGFGLNIPLFIFIKSSAKINLKINASYSDWQNFDEAKDNIDKYSYSLGLSIQP